MIYDIGDIARLSVSFTNLAGVLTNPTVVTLTVQYPDNTQTTPTPTHPSTGLYHYDLPVTVAGVYLYRWEGSGALVVVEEGQITARSTTLVPQPQPPSPPAAPTPPTPITAFTSADLAALMVAIKSGSKRVRFQDREVEYHSLDEMLTLRNIMIDDLTPASGIVRQIRMATRTGL